MKNEKRITLYTLTIHKNDISKDNKKLFDKDYLTKYCRDIFKPNTECYYINHNQDLDNETSEIKEEHIHLVVKFPFNAGKTFTRMKALFPNSHIEECIDFTNGVLYLTHETINAKNENKTLYNRDLVVNVFNSDISKYYDKPILEPFDFDKIEEYILGRHLRTILDFGRVFGYSVIYSKWNIIKDIINALDREIASKPQLEFNEEYTREIYHYGKDNN